MLGGNGSGADTRGSRLSSVAARRMREHILTGRLAAGSRLRVEHLAEEFGVSATPVREALLELAGEGLATRRPGGGFAVASISRQDVVDMYDTQAYLSGELAARSAVALSRRELEQLDGWQNDLEAAAAEERFVEVQRIDFEIHRTINIAADSPKLTWMLAMSLRWVPFTVYSEIPGWPLASRDDHRAILRAMCSRTTRTARDNMQAHIRNCGDSLVRWLDDQGVLYNPARTIQ